MILVMTAGFMKFWAKYPRKVGKLASLRQWDKALRIASEEEILEGEDRYIANKPAWQDWCHPATFLSQGRWMDEYGPKSKPKGAEQCISRHGPSQRDLEMMAEYERKKAGS